MRSQPAAGGVDLAHNETGQQMGTRSDGGPTSWQAVIRGGQTVEPFREFYLQ